MPKTRAQLLLKEKYKELHMQLAKKFNTTPHVIAYIRSGWIDKGGHAGLLERVAKKMNEKELEILALGTLIEKNKTPEKQSQRVHLMVNLTAKLKHWQEVNHFLIIHGTFELEEMRRIDL